MECIDLAVSAPACHVQTGQDDARPFSLQSSKADTKVPTTLFAKLFWMSRPRPYSALPLSRACTLYLSISCPEPSATAKHAAGGHFVDAHSLLRA